MLLFELFSFLAIPVRRSHGRLHVPGKFRCLTSKVPVLRPYDHVHVRAM
jgi:hypothetical protein